jgi:hypothetical protein
MTRRRLPPGVSFSLGRAIGLTKVKRQASGELGVPLSRQARQRRLGASLGCCVMLAFPTTLIAAAIWRIIGA